MSARTSTNSASPPARSIVSGEVASSRERPGSGATATFVIARSGFTFGFVLGLAGSRRSTRLSRRAEAGGGWDTTRVKAGAGGGATAR